MKKHIIIGLLLILLIIPLDVKAEEKEYKTMNLDEALTQEEIKHDFSNYKETDDQITIYLFRGNGCHFCQDFLNFLNSIIDEYGKYFKVVSYETWYNKDNSDLLNEVSTFMGKSAKGAVPYIIIGDKVFSGYNSKYDEEIKTAVKDLYNNKDRYDVFEDMASDTCNLALIKTNITEVKTSLENLEKKVDKAELMIIISNLFFVGGAAWLVISFNSYKYSKIINKMEQNELKKKASKTNK